MASTRNNSSAEERTALPPGTFKLIRDDGGEINRKQVVMLDPVPTNDPNEPLNWSTLRKSVNFTIVMGMSIIIFTALSIQQIFWQQMIVDLNVTYSQLTQSMSVNFVGLAMGCVLFIPFAKKFGRRPVYIISTALMLVTSFWTASLTSLTELYIGNLLQGLAGATNEAIVEITIADLFFVHHRGTTNAIYMTMVMIGSFLTPMAAGAQATRQGWRWSYKTMGIFNAIFLVLFAVLYEETKYVPVISGRESITPATDDDIPVKKSDDVKDPVECETKPTTVVEPSNIHHEIDLTIPMNSWRKRLALVTPTPEPIWPYFYRPFNVLVTFPVVMFTALQYAACVGSRSQRIGFMSVGPFIGNLIGSAYGGVLGDWSIKFFSRRNKGFYEPEMRLYILHLPALVMTGGIIMFGVTIEKGMHWIYPSVAGAMFGFGLGGISDVVLTLVIDSYRDITGDAFTGIAFVRNAVSIGIPFAINPWIERDGIQNMFIACGFISLAITGLIIPMVIWGKDSRRKLATKYYSLVDAQGHNVSS